MLSPGGQGFHRAAHAECWTEELLRWLNHQQPKKKKKTTVSLLQYYGNDIIMLWFSDFIKMM